MKKNIFTLFLIINSISASYAQPFNLYHDIFLNLKNSDYILFGNEFINITINKKSGEWEKFNGFGNGVFTSSSGSPAINIKIDNKMVFNERRSDFIDFKTTINKNDNSVSLQVIKKFGNEYELIATYILYSRKALIERCASITYLKSDSIDNKKFEAFYFTIPNLAPGDSKDCFINVPGPFWPATFTPPNTPYDSLKI